MASEQDMVKLPLTLHLSPQARDTIAKRAAAMGADEKALAGEVALFVTSFVLKA